MSDNVRDAMSENNPPIAALLTYWNEAICCDRYCDREIIIERNRDRGQYVHRVAEILTYGMSKLVEQHWEYVNAADNEQPHKCYGAGEYPEIGWSWENVADLLKKLPTIAILECKRTGCLARDSQWYHRIIDFLNDTFPPPDHVWIDFEGSICDFLPMLLKFETSAFTKSSDIPSSDAEQIGRLAIMAQMSWDTNTSRDDWEALYQLVEEFNQCYPENW